MKRTLPLVVALIGALIGALIALPLLAEETKKSEAPKTVKPADSPLVAAAKRSNRLGKKPASKVVITDATLKTAGENAHITSPAEQHNLNMPAEPVRPTPEMVAAEKAAAKRKADEEAAAKKRAEDAKKLRKEQIAVRSLEEEADNREGADQNPEDYQGRPEDQNPQPPPPPSLR
jgi:hypothetical protein